MDEDTKEISALEALNKKGAKHKYFYSSKTTDNLDELLSEALNKENKLPPAMPIFGMSGSGKTETVLNWMEMKNLRAVYIDAACTMVEKKTIKYCDADTMADGAYLNFSPDIFDAKEKELNVIFTPEQIDAFDKNTVVVIDNFTWTKKEQRDELYKLINHSLVTDVRLEGPDRLKKVQMLMLVVIGETGSIMEGRTDFSKNELKYFGIRA